LATTLGFVLFLAPAPPTEASPHGAEAIAWQEYSDAVFLRAKREERLVLLDLGAVWCHWCHVMEETTYRDPAVTALVSARFVAVRVDQDARPDLSNRYEDYGWPATVIFDAEGTELVKFAGYIPPPRMASLLTGVLEDPTPGPSAQVLEPSRLALAGGSDPAHALPEDLRVELERLLVERYDEKEGGWGFEKKFLDWDAVEYSLRRARAGDEDAARRARQTLAAERKLVDPVWGGVYQYSHGGNWDNPHYEKLVAFQAEVLRIYAHAYAQGRDPADLRAARDIERYLTTFLKSPQGGFYVSQDADLTKGQHAADYFALPDPERRRRGIPRVDTHVYARETAWAAFGLLALHEATGEEAPRQAAERAARFLLAHRSLEGGGFAHGETDAGGPYLGDTLMSGRLFLGLYAATGERSWLAHAEAAARFIKERFRRAGTTGFLTAASGSTFAPPLPQREENALLARFANLLFHYTGDEAFRAVARDALAFLSIPAVARRVSTASVLLADLELRTDPLHVTVVGPRDDSRSQALRSAALAEPSAYRRVELWDRREGPLPRDDVSYPRLAEPAVFVCTAGRCSAPARTPEELRSRLARQSEASP
jgi:uncharacterized protein YyaL (SSP411 family)